MKMARQKRVEKLGYVLWRTGRIEDGAVFADRKVVNTFELLNMQPKLLSTG